MHIHQYLNSTRNLRHKAAIYYPKTIVKSMWISLSLKPFQNCLKYKIQNAPIPPLRTWMIKTVMHMCISTTIHLRKGGRRKKKKQSENKIIKSSCLQLLVMTLVAIFMCIEAFTKIISDENKSPCVEPQIKSITRGSGNFLVNLTYYSLNKITS